MPAQNVTITGSFSSVGDTEYTVEYYLENLSGDRYVLNKELTYTGLAYRESLVIANIHDIEGFTYYPTYHENVARANIEADGSTVLKLYYSRNSYTVEYRYDGTVPKGAPEAIGVVSYRYGQVILPKQDPELAGVEFSGWSRSSSFPMPARNIIISGTWC